MKTSAPWHWLNGAVKPAGTPALALADRGAALGDGLFETIRIEAGQPCHFDGHWARLTASAALLRIAVPYSKSSILRALRKLAGANAMERGAARLTLSRGPAPRGLALPAKPAPVMAITMSAGLPRYPQPPVLGLSRLRRNPWSVSCAHKTLSYIDAVAARLHQHSAEMRADVVMCDVSGDIASASAANLFWWHEGSWHTPALNGAILPGTMRARVLQGMAEAGIAACEGRYAPEAMLQAECAFMSNALIGMQALGGVDFGTLGAARYDAHSPSWMQVQDTLRGLQPSWSGAGADKRFRQD